MKVVLLGAGNLALSLGNALVSAGHSVLQVYSRTMKSAEALANLIEATPICNTERITRDADIYIFALKDSALSSIVPLVCHDLKDKLFIHTAGSIEMNIFKEHATNYGVLYPLQTFSREKIVDFTHVPCLVEGSNEFACDILKKLCNGFSQQVYTVTSDERKYIHLAAVFGCNFSNLCYSIAHEILQQHNIPFSILLPLIDETAAKVHAISPKEAQTGPAIRFDQNVMSKQTQLLADNADFRHIYKILSEQIQKISMS